MLDGGAAVEGGEAVVERPVVERRISSGAPAAAEQWWTAGQLWSGGEAVVKRQVVERRRRRSGGAAAVERQRRRSNDRRRPSAATTQIANSVAGALMSIEASIAGDVDLINTAHTNPALRVLMLSSARGGGDCRRSVAYAKGEARLAAAGSMVRGAPAPKLRHRRIYRTRATVDLASSAFTLAAKVSHLEVRRLLGRGTDLPHTAPSWLTLRSPVTMLKSSLFEIR